MEKIFHDPIYGDIEVSSQALQILDTPEFQRLRDISQTGAAQFVFPSATTTRFEHSLGTYALTGRWLDHLGLSRAAWQFELICIGGLTHDLGHGPFSHLFDAWCITEDDGAWAHHEVRSQALFRHLATKLKLFTEKEVNFICEVIAPSSKTWYMNIVNNRVTGIDSDKLDYIVRDQRAFGLPGSVDVQRLIRNSAVLDGEVSFCVRVSGELENLFYVRERLYREIYAHKTIGRVEQLLADIVQTVSPNPREVVRRKDAAAFVRLTDVFVKAHGNPRLWQALARRELPPARASRGLLQPAFYPEFLRVFNRKDKIPLAYRSPRFENKKGKDSSD